MRGARVQGLEVNGHLVTARPNTLVPLGPGSYLVVLQEAVEIRPDDDWDSLEPRIHEVEHRLLPRAVRAMIDGRLRVDGRRVRIVGEES